MLCQLREGIENAKKKEENGKGEINLDEKASTSFH